MKAFESNRASLNEIGTNTELMTNILGSIYAVDLLQNLLPMNNFKYKGLRMEDCSRKLGYEHTTCKGSEIAKLYESKEYEKIKAHIIEDIEANVRLYRSLKNDSFHV
ncbi:MAG: hypothetical protein NTY03_16265 [Candidatus Bathyarchaeota archaeon]|nr:hypothetical protein [Candidatus Bathyarchaeota archaeon]